MVIEPLCCGSGINGPHCRTFGTQASFLDRCPTCSLWPIFQRNRHLLHDLPALGAAVIKQWVKIKFGVEVLITVIPHTFGAWLNFNSHLHILVSAGGMKTSEGIWIDRLYFDRRKLMHM